MDVDHALSNISKWNRWRLIIFVIININKYFPSSWHMLSIVFIGLEPSHHCRVPEWYNISESIPVDKNGEFSKCEVYLNYSRDTNMTIPCPNGWVYGDEIDSIVNQWDLVCDHSYLVATSQFVLVIGIFFGVLICSILADFFGRKTTYLCSLIGISIVGIITASTNNLYLFFVLRFCTGFLHQGATLSGFVLSCELFQASERTIPAQLMNTFWSIGLPTLAVMAYFVRYWRHLMYTISFPGFLGLALLWYVPESIPWLVAEGRVSEAKTILARAAKWNKIELPDEFKNKEQANSECSQEEIGYLSESDRDYKEADSKKKLGFSKIFQRIPFVNFKGPRQKEKEEIWHVQYTIWDIIKSCTLFYRSLLMCFMWCTAGLVYYGLSLSTGEMVGNVYFNFFLSGIAEIPSSFCSAFFLQYIGRRRPVIAFYFIAGLSLLVIILVPNKTDSGASLSWVITTLTMIGKFGITAAWNAVFLWAHELYPTTIRNTGIGLASMGARVGSTIAPYSALMAKHLPWLPNVIFGSLGLLACVSSFFLPETLNRPLPTTIGEVEGWKRTFSEKELIDIKQRSQMI